MGRRNTPLFKIKPSPPTFFRQRVSADTRERDRLGETALLPRGAGAWYARFAKTGRKPRRAPATHSITIEAYPRIHARGAVSARRPYCPAVRGLGMPVLPKRAENRGARPQLTQ